MGDARASDEDDGWALRISRGVAAGSREALAELYAARYGRIHRYLRERTRRDDAFVCDCSHDAWLRVLRGMPALPSVAALDAWLVRVALSAALDRIKSDAARLRREQASAAGESCPPPTPDDVVELEVELGRVSAAEREALRLRVVDGLRFEHVAAVQEIEPKAAESRVRRALGRLRGRRSEPSP